MRNYADNYLTYNLNRSICLRRSKDRRNATQILGRRHRILQMQFKNCKIENKSCEELLTKQAQQTYINNIEITLGCIVGQDGLVKGQNFAKTRFDRE
ncbi:hypothetical protein FGO68_gene6875 [Halteria grandinella]|uniref:Uncharacterized protein n=1 Tax=Halteria grandinella TaxID=5974 RepID=A0A8J8SU73_HALGN|nr:hypothetical protein FGO68_gene6875 [Halteria grandinella]